MLYLWIELEDIWINVYYNDNFRQEGWVKHMS
jgi:hypothetical protein